MKKIPKLSLLTLIISNLYPLYLVYKGDMTALAVVILFILETLIIGIYTVFKIRKAGEFQKQNKERKVDDLFMFSVGYFFFVLIQFVFFMGIMAIYYSQKEIPKSVWTPLGERALWESLIFITLSHGFSFYWNFLRKKEYEKKINYTTKTMKRVMAQQVMVLVGGMLVEMTSGALAFVIVLVFAKMIFDIRGHHKFHTSEEKAEIS